MQHGSQRTRISLYPFRRSHSMIGSLQNVLHSETVVARNPYRRTVHPFPLVLDQGHGYQANSATRGISVSGYAPRPAVVRRRSIGCGRSCRYGRATSSASSPAGLAIGVVTASTFGTPAASETAAAAAAAAAVPVRRTQIPVGSCSPCCTGPVGTVYRLAPTVPTLPPRIQPAIARPAATCSRAAACGTVVAQLPVLLRGD